MIGLIPDWIVKQAAILYLGGSAADIATTVILQTFMTLLILGHLVWHIFKWGQTAKGRPHWLNLHAAAGLWFLIVSMLLASGRWMIVFN